MAYSNLETQYERLFEKNIEPLQISIAFSSYLDYSKNEAIVFLSLLLTVVLLSLSQVSLICQIETTN